MVLDDGDRRTICTAGEDSCTRSYRFRRSPPSSASTKRARTRTPRPSETASTRSPEVAPFRDRAPSCGANRPAKTPQRASPQPCRPSHSRGPRPFPSSRLRPLRLAVEPPKRWIVLDDNSRIEIDQDLLIGRDPDHASATKLGLRAVRLADVTGEMSRAHIEVRVFNGQVIITDRNSSNGSFVREPAQQGWTRLAPWQSAKWRPGAYVQIGGRILRLHMPTAHGPQRGPRVNVQHDIPQSCTRAVLTPRPSRNNFARAGDLRDELRPLKRLRDVWGCRDSRQEFARRLPQP